MVRIQTAGEQRYYDFISGRARQVRTGMIVWASLLSLALSSLFNNIVVALVLAVAAAALAVSNVKAQRELKEKLSRIPDKEEFFRQLADPEVLTAQGGHVLVARDYVLTDKTDISIYFIPDMEKAEAGRIRNGRKTLFLTDRSGKRHEIMSCTKEGEALKEFDAVYHALKAGAGVKND